MITSQQKSFFNCLARKKKRERLGVEKGFLETECESVELKSDEAAQFFSFHFGDKGGIMICNQCYFSR